MEQIKKKLSERLTDYQPIPFWSWNDALDPEELKRQISWMNENGIGGFFMHARGGLKTPYLSEEWMQCIEACCDEAEKLGMNAWAYDENGWPSGFVGGRLLENMANRDMYVDRSYGAFDKDADVSYLLTADRLVRVSGKTAARETAARDMDGEYLNLYLKPTASTVDILNPEVVKKFLALTHEQYKEHFGAEFSRKVKGFFTDEPQYYRWSTPYTPMIRAYFRERYNEDILDHLGLLFEEKEGYRTFRYRYWLGMQRLMLDSFARLVYEWCDENGVSLTGHYIEESTMGFQILCCGGVMPFYKYEHVPGIDWLGAASDNELPPRQLNSAARQLGKKQQLTETFACCGWDISPADLRRIAGFQFANGVNLLCHHLVPYSEHGQRKRDHPAHYCPSNPWVKEFFKEFNDYFTRLGYLLAESEEPVNVAMLHPVRSCYFDYKRDLEACGYGVADMDRALREACRTLSSRGIAYHFLDETLLEEHGFVKGNAIGCGLCSYDYLVLPRTLTMGAHTEQMLREYVANGGKVLLLEEKPGYLEGEPYDYSYLESNCTLEDLVRAQPYSVANTDTQLYATYRKYADASFLYLQNASGDKAYTQTFDLGEDIRSFVALDPVTLQTKKLPLTVTLPESEALLLFPSEETVQPEAPLEEYELRFRDAGVWVDHNLMTLDVVRYSKNGTDYSEPLLRNRLFHQLLEERYEGMLWIKYDFEIRVLPGNLTLLAEKGDGKSFYVNDKEFTFTESFADEPTIWMADITELVQEGVNSYTVMLNWHQSEATYYALFGENVTESLRNCIAYDSEIEDVYLAGRFGVYSDAAFTDYAENTLCGHDFYIGAVPEMVSEPVTDGLPFFRGQLTLSRKITLSSKNTLLKILGRYQTARVSVNGSEFIELGFSRRLDLSPYAKEGENEITVTFTIGNRNLLGPFHTGGPETGVSPGSFEASDLPDAENGSAVYRFRRFYTD